MPDTIRIILTGYSDTQVIIDAINKAKIYKFITKPFEPEELSLTVQRGIEAYQMRQEILEYTNKLEQIVHKRTEELNQKNEELKVALANLEQLSLTDQLTGVHNRHFICEFMPQEMAKIKRDMATQSFAESHMGLIILDIDFFKQVNDDYGHNAGDIFLKQFAQVIKRTCRESDCVVRWGGEEFVVIARGLDLARLQQLAERIRVNIFEEEFVLSSDLRIQKTCSLGVVSLPFLSANFDALTWEQTLNLADLALYIAKKNGRNNWVSLFENQNTQYQDIYQDAIGNLKALIESGGISYQSSLSGESIKL